MYDGPHQGLTIAPVTLQGQREVNRAPPAPGWKGRILPCNPRCNPAASRRVAPALPNPIPGFPAMATLAHHQVGCGPPKNGEWAPAFLIAFPSIEEL
jgi:hypothetical protein